MSAHRARIHRRNAKRVGRRLGGDESRYGSDDENELMHDNDGVLHVLRDGEINGLVSSVSFVF